MRRISEIIRPIIKIFQREQPPTRIVTNPFADLDAFRRSAFRRIPGVVNGLDMDGTESRFIDESRPKAP